MPTPFAIIIMMVLPDADDDHNDDHHHGHAGAGYHNLPDVTWAYQRNPGDRAFLASGGSIDNVHFCNFWGRRLAAAGRVSERGLRGSQISWVWQIVGLLALPLSAVAAA